MTLAIIITNLGKETSFWIDVFSAVLSVVCGIDGFFPCSGTRGSLEIMAVINYRTVAFSSTGKIDR